METPATEIERTPSAGGRSSERSFPASYAQERFWFMDRLAPGTTAYVIADALWLRGRFDTSAFDRALREVVRRHSSLRTVFRDEGGRPVQVVLPRVDAGLVVRNVSSSTGAEREAERLARAEAAKPFDLERGPLVRATLFSIGHDDALLLLACHHIAVDGWTQRIVASELCALYAAYAEGREAALAEPGLQYHDYAAWERQLVASGALDGHVEYWRERLEGLEPLDLPGDRRRDTSWTPRAESLHFEFPQELLERVTAEARRNEATLYMALLVALQVLLARWSGQHDVAVATPYATRTRIELESLVGCVINTLVFRTDVSGDPTFAQLLERVREVTVGAYAHAAAPFELVLERLKAPRHPGRPALAQVMFVLQNAPPGRWTFPGVETEHLPLSRRHARYDLALIVHTKRGDVPSTIEYDADVFDAETIERFVEQYLTLLEAVTAEPERPLSQLPLLPESERKRLLHHWTSTDAPAAETAVHELVAARAQRHPDATAVVYRGETLGYAEVERRSDALAAALSQVGVRRGDRVGLFLDRSDRLPTSILAVLKAGAAYVPLDPAYPEERIRLMIDDAAPRAIVVDTHLRDSLPHACGAVFVDSAAEGTADTAARAPRVGPLDAAYVVYTSGSTGRPKGVVVPHGALTNALQAFASAPGLAAGERVLAITTASFDIAALELLLPLVVGGEVEILPDDVARDPLRLAARLGDGSGLVLQATPATWRALVDSGWRGSPRLRALCGGEALAEDLATALAGRAAEVWNLYGPSETTIWSLVQKVCGHGETPPIGRPVANTRVYVVDEAGAPLPIGAPGELLIGGRGVATCYLGRPALTADRFVADPFGSEHGGRLYRTGDRVRYRTDGSLSFLGRLDQQVKIRGFRVELGEVEAALRSHPEMRDAVVVATGEAGGMSLVGYVVPTSPQGPSEQGSTLRAHLRRLLPDFMVPSELVLLDRPPLTPNGKIDRQRLRSAKTGRRLLSAKHHGEPRNERERRVARLWKGVLQHDGIGVDDDFFELGGHSLLVNRLAAEIGREFRVALPIRSLFEHRTIAAQTAEIESALLAGLNEGELDELVAAGRGRR